jgi:PAS domain S-box-containing protein
MPLGYAVCGVLATFALFRYGFLDLVPVARDAVIENLIDAVIVLDGHDRIVDLNPAAQALLGCARADALGRLAAEVLPPSLAESGTAPAVEASVGHGADRRYFDCRSVPLRLRDGRPIGRLITLHDITAPKQAEQEREQLIEDLEAYAHTVAHDLKGPLALCVGYLELLRDLRGPAQEELIQEHLDTLVGASYKMRNIIDELLLLASVRVQQSVELVEIDMEAVVRGAQSRVADLIVQSGAVVASPRQWPTVLGYAPWVEEVWANYLSNAVKYGGSPPRVELGADQSDDGHVRFWVRDNGRGLTPAEQARLFALFSRLDQARAEGHGLGLSIVRRIVEKLGGQVGVESEVGVGSTFYFTLPAGGVERER